METNPIAELSKMLKTATSVLESTVNGLDDEKKQLFTAELNKQGYSKKMNELKNKMAELNKLTRK